MLKKEKVINLAIINNISTWQHSGFNVHCGRSASFSDIEAVERLARYIVRAPISQERLEYYPPQASANDSGKVIYEGKTTGKVETFSAIDFLARLVTHIPNKREQTVRYYGYYSNKSRGVRAKAEAEANTADELTNVAAATVNASDEATNAAVPNIIPISLSRKHFKKNWARLIQKVYNVDPLKCPKCGGKMRIVSFIEDENVIKRILSHLNLWLPQYHDPPDYPASCYSSVVHTADISPSQLDIEKCGNLQLNMFSGRSYEWWEASNRLSNTSNSSSEVNKLHQNILPEDNNNQFSFAEYQRPYEDEFSQEVFYED